MKLPHLTVVTIVALGTIASCNAAEASATTWTNLGATQSAERIKVQYRDGNRNLSRAEVAYYCSLGDQTPISVRSTCIRLGIGGWGRGGGGRGYDGGYGGRGGNRSLSNDEIAYYCSLGSQTPISVRSTCIRRGIGGWGRGGGGRGY
jgi:hypothetical protein